MKVNEMSDVCGCCGRRMDEISTEVFVCPSKQKRCVTCKKDFTPETFVSLPPCKRGFKCLSMER